MKPQEVIDVLFFHEISSFGYDTYSHCSEEMTNNNTNCEFIFWYLVVEVKFKLGVNTK